MGAGEDPLPRTAVEKETIRAQPEQETVVPDIELRMPDDPCDIQLFVSCFFTVSDFCIF